MLQRNYSGVKQLQTWPNMFAPDTIPDPSSYTPIIKLLFDIYIQKLFRAQMQIKSLKPWGKPIAAGSFLGSRTKKEEEAACGSERKQLRRAPEKRVTYEESMDYEDFEAATNSKNESCGLTKRQRTKASSQHSDRSGNRLLNPQQILEDSGDKEEIILDEDLLINNNDGESDEWIPKKKVNNKKVVPRGKGRQKLSLKDSASSSSPQKARELTESCYELDSDVTQEMDQAEHDLAAVATNTRRVAILSKPVFSSTEEEDLSPDILGTHSSSSSGISTHDLHCQNFENKLDVVSSEMGGCISSDSNCEPASASVSPKLSKTNHEKSEPSDQRLVIVVSASPEGSSLPSCAIWSGKSSSQVSDSLLDPLGNLYSTQLTHRAATELAQSGCNTDSLSQSEEKQSSSAAGFSSSTSAGNSDEQLVDNVDNAEVQKKEAGNTWETDNLHLSSGQGQARRKAHWQKKDTMGSVAADCWDTCDTEGRGLSFGMSLRQNSQGQVSAGAPIRKANTKRKQSHVDKTQNKNLVVGDCMPSHSPQKRRKFSTVQEVKAEGNNSLENCEVSRFHYVKQVNNGTAENVDKPVKVRKAECELLLMSPSSIFHKSERIPETDSQPDSQLSQERGLCNQARASSSADQNTCPICGCCFPPSRLEAHAASCGDDVPMVSDTDTCVQERCICCHKMVPVDELRLHQAQCLVTKPPLKRVTRSTKGNIPLC